MPKFKYLKKGLVNFWHDIRDPLIIPPSGIERSSLGESVEKRPIDCFRVGRGARKVLFVSAIHGNEIGTIKLAHFLLGHLARNEIKFEKTIFFVVPCLNVDGFEKAKGIREYPRAIRGRLNARKVDLNRNFPASNFRSRCLVLPKEESPVIYKYRKEVSVDSEKASNLDLAQKNCGDFGGSEPETKALVDFVEKEKISVIFSFHNSGRDVMGGKDELSRELVKIYAEKSGYEILEDEDWRKLGQAGTMKDWCDENGFSFVEVEGSSRYSSDWKEQKPALEAALKYLEEKA